MQELLLPDGINYECTGCGKCCSGWAVPMTQTDYERISAVDWADVHEAYSQRSLFRELKPKEREGTPYSYKIVSDSGICPFLVNNLCHMHSKHGAEFKPSICQLFPYCFSQTPSGVYATVSFVSAGAIYNSGKPLAEQRELLEEKWREFQRMYPDYQPDWSQIKLTVNQPISWEQYLQLEQGLLEIIGRKDKSVEERLLEGSAFLMGKLEGPSAGTKYDTTVTSASLKPLDVSLLLTFHKMYFPVRTLKRSEADFNVPMLVRQHFFGSKRLQAAKQSFSLDDLHAIEWPDDQEINNIVDRYVLTYIWGKKYFGAGFGQVSVIAGFHHLIMMIALLKLQSKASARMREARVVNLLDVASSVRQLERQVGETRLGGYAAAAWEVLLHSHERARRLLSNC